jgi:hypothetical protein
MQRRRSGTEGQTEYCLFAFRPPWERRRLAGTPRVSAVAVQFRTSHSAFRTQATVMSLLR